MKPYLAVCSVIGLPFTGDTVLVLGEIEQMPGHVVVATKDGRVFYGYHADNFDKLDKDDC